MLADRLAKAWRERRESSEIDAVMRFSDEGLVLGVGTVLARCSESSGGMAVDPRDERLHALLAAAHGKYPSAGSLVHLSKAAERWNEGQRALAATHLALSRLERLQQPETDAQRLFLADGMLEAGFEPYAIFKAILAGDAELTLIGGVGGKDAVLGIEHDHRLSVVLQI